MIGGFLFQLTALRYGPLALVQPILAVELLLVFGYMAVAGSGRVRVRRRDWLAAAVMSAGIGVFLLLASPSGGRLHAPAPAWLFAGLITLGLVLLALALAFGHGGRPVATRSRRAALLGCATGISWGFVAAVIKELSSHIDDGVGAVFSNWSLYVLLAVGAATMLLASHALAAGPLAASSRGSPSSTRCPQACSACSYSTSTSGRASWTWRARRWRWPSSSPVPGSSATAA